MNQTLKISIVRGACRFATPLYLGGKYDITFSGERSDEAKTILFTKCKSKNPNETDGIEALAVSTTSEEGNVSMNLNKQVLVDFFKKSGECDVDGSVDVHAYIFDENGVVLADSDVSIEFKPLDFVIDAEEINRYGILLARIVAVEDRATELETKDVVHEATLAQLAKVDEDNKAELNAEILRKAEEVLSDAKTWASKLSIMIARMSYIRCAQHSSDEKDLYHKVDVIINEHGECVLRVDQTPVQFDGSAADGDVKFLYSDEAQDIVADKVFKGSKLTISNDGARVGSFYVADGADFDVATSARFLNDLSIAGDLSVGGDLDVDGNVSVDSAHHFTGNIHNSGASVVTAVRNVADGDDANNAASTHWVRTRIANWWTAILATIRGIFVDFSSEQAITGKKTFVGSSTITRKSSEAKGDEATRASVSYVNSKIVGTDNQEIGNIFTTSHGDGSNSFSIRAANVVNGVLSFFSLNLRHYRTGAKVLSCNADSVKSDAIAGAGFPSSEFISCTRTTNIKNDTYDHAGYIKFGDDSASTEAPFDGYIAVLWNSRNDSNDWWSVIVEHSTTGNEIWGVNMDRYFLFQRAFLPVRKGDRVRLSWRLQTIATLRFYKLKGQS